MPAPFVNVHGNAHLRERALRLGGNPNLRVTADCIGTETGKWENCWRGVRIVRSAPDADSPTPKQSCYDVLVTTVARGRIVIDMAARVDADGRMTEPGRIRSGPALLPLQDQPVLDELYDELLQAMNFAATSGEVKYWDVDVPCAMPQ